MREKCHHVHIISVFIDWSDSIEESMGKVATIRSNGTRIFVRHNAEETRCGIATMEARIAIREELKMGMSRDWTHEIG